MVRDQQHAGLYVQYTVCKSLLNVADLCQLRLELLTLYRLYPFNLYMDQLIHEQAVVDK